MGLDPPSDIRGPWSRGTVEHFLDGARVPVRIACNGAAGYPLLASLWFVAREGSLWCATQRSARVAERLAADGRCAFEISTESPPYQGIRGRGVATLRPERGPEILELLIARYLAGSSPELAEWLRRRAANETAIEIAPQTLLSWDYRDRMEPSP
jgi:hypothetical protein